MDCKKEINLLNKQNFIIYIFYTKNLLLLRKDVGKTKVECAVKNAEFHNVGNTIIHGYHMDAVVNWDKIVELAK
jgi:hypothetical protein